MLITTAKVNNGLIEVDSNALPDGTTVTLLAHEEDEVFALDATQETLLLAAIAEAERGEVINAEELLHKLRSS
jgi:riboflavin synthase alpha subunit